MSNAHWQRVQDIYHAVLERPASVRTEFLREACAGDAALLHEVQSLLDQPISAEQFLVRGEAGADNTPPVRLGQRLGAYQIQALIGRGGMGEVYRARDTRLGRDVAIKLLPDSFAADPERCARFEREARMLATLNHPHIGAIYGLEEIPSTNSGQAPGCALVLELVEGDTLADRLARGPLPVTETLGIARQIMEALEAAHEKGIVHRDLKPSNISITRDGVVKVLDFGLAKAVAGDGSGLDLSQSPTLTVGGTRDGMILGTAAYMSPEQARGKPVDKRADIWAFGCVLYEMLTGRAPFAGETLSDVIVAILERDPDWGALPQTTSPSVRRLLERCLEKDSRRRLRDIGDARVEIEWAPGSKPTAPAASARPRQRVVAVLALVATVAGVAAATMAILYFQPAAVGELTPIRFTVAPPQGVTLNRSSSQSAAVISPNGRHLAFTATDRTGHFLLWVRSLDAPEAQPVAGTESALFPFWSPDSRTVGFFSIGQLRAVDISTGSVRSICVASAAQGGAWSRDGTIIFAPHVLGGLFKVAAAGGSPAPLTTPDASRKETAHRFPSFLPDGRHFLYFVAPLNTVRIGSLDSPETSELLHADSQAQFAAPGYLLFARQSTLLAQAFDPRSMKLSGEPAPVAEKVTSQVVNNYAVFSVSDGGILVYETGQISGRTQLAWTDRTGKRLGTVGLPGLYRNPALSPDGTRVAVEVTDPQRRAQDIWIIDLPRNSSSGFTFDPANEIYPIWSPNGRRVLFGSDRDGGVFNLYQKVANGVGADERVLRSDDDMAPATWSPDGASVVYRAVAGAYNLGILPLNGKDKPRLLLPASSFHQGHGEISPDGRWIAYHSDESGRYEIYIRNFPTPVGKWRISQSGGLYAKWRGDGKELYYYAVDGRLMAVPINGGDTVQVGTPVPLFEPHLLNGPYAALRHRKQYDVTQDGQKFLLNVPQEENASPPITVVVNWSAGLEK